RRIPDLAPARVTPSMLSDASAASRAVGLLSSSSRHPCSPSARRLPAGTSLFAARTRSAAGAELEQWCRELLDKSPTALALAKQSFNVDSEQRAGVAQLAHTALQLYYGTEEALEGRNAFVEKRAVDYRKFRR